MVLKSSMSFLKKKKKKKKVSHVSCIKTKVAIKFLKKTFLGENRLLVLKGLRLLVFKSLIVINVFLFFLSKILMLIFVILVDFLMY